MTDFTHLHVHSYNSLMDGLNSPSELLSAAKEMGQTSLAITDHGTLSGHRDLQRSARELGMKPILGLEAYISPTDRFDKRDVKAREDDTSLYNHLIVIAKNQTGLKNLQTLSEKAWTEGYYYKPRIDKEILEEYRDGLIILSGCMSGLISKAISRGDMEYAHATTQWFKDTFEDNFFMEIQPHNPLELNHSLLQLADFYSIKPVVTSDCHYAKQQDKAIEEMMLILSTSPKINKDADFEKSRKIKDIYERLNYLWPDRPISFEDIEVWVQGRADVQTAMENQGITRTDIYENTVGISDSVEDYEFNSGLSLLPSPKVEPNARLRKLCMDGLRSMLLDSNVKYLERLDYELSVIQSKDFASYFLIVGDMIGWAKNNGILVGPGRGSAAGSLVCYALGITQVDPLEYDLLFGRFINEERNDFPDIDVDFEDRRRKEVKDYLVRKFKNVASIATFNFFKDKGVIRDAARVYGIPLAEVNKALKTVDTFEDYETSRSTDEFRRKYPEVTDLAKRLRGRIRGTGLHAAGIVVASEPISNFAPIETRKDPKGVANERIPVVAYDMNEVADIGLIKMDALGLKTLSVISDTLQFVKERHNKDINLNALPLDDPKIFKSLSNGFTRGLFQVEAVPYTNLLIKMGTENFNDLAASNALVRPGAMNTVGEIYISRKHGRSQVNYAHDILRDITESTYGVIIYQEQVMRACVELAGMTWSQADKIRKIIGKKKDAKEFDQYRSMFVEGASKHISRKKAEDLWTDFEAHAGYSFNKSHAVAYSMLTYWTAWLKHYYPTEFMCSAMRNEGDKDVLTEYLIEAKRLKIDVILPHVNISDVKFSIQGDSIVFGLSSVKFISDNTATALIRSRPFRDYAHLIEVAATKNSGINSRMISALDKIGGAAFEDNPKTGEERHNMYEYLGVPNFESGSVPENVLPFVSKCDDFEERGVFIIIGMVKNIKRGKGWSRVEMVDDSGSVGVFHSENTQIETGSMYLFLIGDNRIHRYVEIDDVERMNDDAFVKMISSPDFSVPENEYYVVDFTNYKTKTGKMMAHTIIANGKKEMRRVLVFNKNYPSALVKMKPGTTCKLTLARTDDETLFVAGV